MKTRPFLFILGLLLCGSMAAQPLEKLPNDPHFAQFRVVRAPKVNGPVLRSGDRLAICGDSITEQRRYSQIIETYLTVALPEMNVTTRQFGWSGEQASGFVGRMTNDVLRFDPTIATTCYGMNDHHYQPYTEPVGRAYRSNSVAMVEAFKRAGTRVILGSPGCMGYNRPPWQKMGTARDSNLSLCQLRNIDIQIAKEEHTGFADIFWPMFRSDWLARQLYGTNYSVAGKDNVHPNWAGHLIMAYSFLKALDVPGEIGVLTVDLKSNRAKVSQGHELVSFNQGVLTVKSFRYPFCATGAVNDDNSIRSGMSLVPFNQMFNRLMLVVKRGNAQNYKITWGAESRIYSAAQLRRGVNLADDFPVNPFSEAFAKVNQAVAAKQAYETRQIKELFHGDAGKADMEKMAQETEAARAPLVAAIKAAFVPVTHEITITPQ